MIRPGVWLMFLLLADHALAASINFTNAGTSACIAVLVVVFSLLCLLLIAKRIFLQTRRCRYRCITSSHSGTADLSTQSSMPFFSSAFDVNSSKAGFLVGFLGSPSWETSVMNLVSDSEVTNSDPHLSFSSYYYSVPRRSKSIKTPYSSLSNNSSVHVKTSSFAKSLVGGSYNSYPLVGEIAQPAEHKKTTLRPLPRPSPIYEALSSKTIRRFSMPSMPDLNNTVGNWGRIKRASSVDSRTARFDLHMSCLIGNPSLRLVQATSNPDKPLPLAPQLNRSCDSRFRLDRFPIRPLLVLQRKSATHERDQRQNLSKSQISHPLPLGVNSAFVSSPMSSPSANFSSCAAPSDARGDQSPEPVPKSLSPVVVSINLSPLSVPYPPATCEAELETSSHSRPAVIFPNFRPKEARKSSLRVQRSPAIGPSPLRTMIHPDPSDPKIVSQASASHVFKNADAKPGHSTLGLGFPKSPSALGSGIEPPSGRTSNLDEDSIEPRRTTFLPTQNSNTLSGLIRELVEETDNWDGSLFKDKHFKAMIDDSKVSKNRRNSGHGVMEDVSPRYDLTVERDQSAEVDLALLGLDIFRSGGETFIPGAQDEDMLQGNDT